MQLKKEHGDGKCGEQGEALEYRTLLRMLDALDEAVIGVNESEEIRFCNRACEKLLLYPTDDLRGRLIWSIFRTNTADLLRPFLCADDEDFCVSGQGARVFRVGLERRCGNNCYVNVQVVPFLSECSVYFLFILKWPGKASGFIWQRQWNVSVTPVDEELSVIEETLKGLGVILTELLPEPSVETGQILFGLSEINLSLVRINHLLQRSPPPTSKQAFLAVKVMSLCVEYWIECCGTDKFDLARESKFWTVYTNPDGWERTQTLDKYFDINRLPKRPNWKKILATANFVLTRCSIPSLLREKLEIFSERLQFSMDE
ncbi:MAG: PAS domain-containing protein [Desulfurivibrio sp.]|nr:PAS domain-containing protein [Desulfurivibrio sp.]MBU4118530.1 PAS domain-containing protein [Pseudomonadota bacterium]